MECQTCAVIRELSSPDHFHTFTFHSPISSNEHFIKGGWTLERRTFERKKIKG